MLIIGFRIQMDSFAIFSFIGLKMFNELSYLDDSFFARSIMNYCIFLTLNAIFFFGKNLNDDTIEIDPYYQDTLIKFIFLYLLKILMSYYFLEM